jgi:predicted acylesterase/phospholipase RssA
VSSPIRRWIRHTLGLETTGAGPCSAFDIIAKSVEAMQERMARHRIAAQLPDIVVEIPVEACGVPDFRPADEMIGLGCRQNGSSGPRLLHHAAANNREHPLTEPLIRPAIALRRAQPATFPGHNPAASAHDRHS